jgi:hypothetical protein
MNRAQARAFGAGTVLALERKKDNQKITYSVEGPPSISEAFITDALKYALFVLCGLNPATVRLDVVYGATDIYTILAEKDAALKMVQKKNAQMTDELERLKSLFAKLSGQAFASQKEPRWISVREAAEIKHVAEMTIYRAIDEGRIKSRSKLVNSKRHHEVDIETFVPKARKIAKRKKTT